MQRQTHALCGLTLMLTLFIVPETAHSGLFGCQNCSSGQPHTGCCGDHQHAMTVGPALQSGCQCGHAAAGCCGIGGGFSCLGGMCSSGQLIGSAGSLQGSWNGGFLSGYEGLPDMDGGGVHHRYPYHSYRRPWFHPGPASANVSIVW